MVETNKKQQVSLDNLKKVNKIFSSKELETSFNEVKKVRLQLDNLAKIAKSKIKVVQPASQEVKPQIPETKPVEVKEQKVASETPNDKVKVETIKEQPSIKENPKVENKEQVVKTNNEKTTQSFATNLSSNQNATNQGGQTNNNQVTNSQTANNNQTYNQQNSQRNNNRQPYQQRYVNNNNYGNRPNNNQSRPYGQNNGYQGNRPYNNYQNNGGYQGNRPYNNQNRPYNQNGNFQQRPFNNNYQNNGYQGNRPYNNQQRPFNQNGYQRPYNPNYRPFNQNGMNNNGRPNFNNAQGRFNRPNGQGAFKLAKPDSVLISKEVSNKFGANSKKKNNREYDDKKTINKKSLILRNIIDEENGDYFNDGRVSSRKLKMKQPKQIATISAPVTNLTITTQNISVKELSEKTGRSVAEIVKQLFLLGIMATINSTIDFTTAQLVCGELGVTLDQKLVQTAEDQLIDETSYKDIDKSKWQKRPPVITVMGHVDHGKTSLLDAIRKTNVVEGEAGGITQKIGAYSIKKDGNVITFIDTPGHEAFSAMRARGAMLTDIAVLVVAADDGVMPQTIEAITQIKKAKVPMIVAINKIDKPEANPERVKEELTKYDVVPEEWGGDTICVPISAKKGTGIDKLLEMMLLVADMQDLKADPKLPAVGAVIEARLDRGRGPVVSVLVQNGTLKIGNTVVCGTTYGKVRAMIDSNGKNVVSAGPSIAVSVMGFMDVPNAGDSIQVVDEKLCKQIVEERKTKQQLDMVKNSSGQSIDDFMSNKEDGITRLNIVLKADVQGSVEALLQSIVKLDNDEVKTSIIHSGAGAINENDVLLAQASKSIIVSFNVKSEAKILDMAKKLGVEVLSYDIIYDILDELQTRISKLIKPKYQEVVIGHATVKMVYDITGIGNVAGCLVEDGKITRTALVRVLRDKAVVATTKVSSLKLYKDEAKEITAGTECGIRLDFDDVKVGDTIEAYIEQEITK